MVLYYNFDSEQMKVDELENTITQLNSLITERDSEIERLKAENDGLASKMHDILSQLEIATDLGNTRWIALNEIVEHAGMKSADWCRRIAKEGLGLK